MMQFLISLTILFFFVGYIIYSFIQKRRLNHTLKVYKNLNKNLIEELENLINKKYDFTSKDIEFKEWNKEDFPQNL